MKKIIKYSLYGLIYLSIIFVLALFFIATAKADLIKPNNTKDGILKDCWLTTMVSAPIPLGYSYNLINNRILFRN